jgi:two-component system sensor histidine kinase FlrB
VVDVGEDAVVNADRDLLRVAVGEMIDNLTKHCGACTARVSAKREKGEWVLEIADDGPGMAKEMLEQWLDPAKRGQIKDRGLGLTLVQLIARAMGGKLEGVSGEGKGLKLRMWIGSGGGD